MSRPWAQQDVLPTTSPPSSRAMGRRSCVMHGALVCVEGIGCGSGSAASRLRKTNPQSAVSNEIFGNARKMSENITIGSVSPVIASAGRQNRPHQDSASARRSWPDLAVVPIVIVGIREVAGFLFGLLLLCPHTIELRFIEHDLDRVVPAQISVLRRGSRGPALSSSSGPRSRLSSNRSSISSNFSRSSLAAMECAIGLARAGHRPGSPS